MRPFAIVLAAAALAASGCGIPGACVSGSASMYGGVQCRDVATSVDSEGEDVDDPCPDGELHDFQTCSGLGFTIDCGDYSVRPGTVCTP